MILAKNSLLELIKNSNLIDEYDEERLQPASYDLTISKKFTKIIKKDCIIDITSKKDIESLYEQIEVDEYLLKPHESVLVTLNEKINMPVNMVGEIRPRTSLERALLSINHQHINPGYNGIIQLRLTNNSDNIYRIYSGLVIGQLVVSSLSKEDSYTAYESPKYQNESNPKGSRIYEDKIGKKFRHFKGHIYEVIEIAKDCEDLKDLVIYKNVETGEIWVRSYDEFTSPVDKEKYKDVEQFYRFEELEDK